MEGEDEDVDLDLDVLESLLLEYYQNGNVDSDLSDLIEAFLAKEERGELYDDDYYYWDHDYASGNDRGECDGGDADCRGEESDNDDDGSGFDHYDLLEGLAFEADLRLQEMAERMAAEDEEAKEEEAKDEERRQRRERIRARREARERRAEGPGGGAGVDGGLGRTFPLASWIAMAMACLLCWAMHCFRRNRLAMAKAAEAESRKRKKTGGARAAAARSARRRDGRRRSASPTPRRADAAAAPAESPMDSERRGPQTAAAASHQARGARLSRRRRKAAAREKRMAGGASLREKSTPARCVVDPATNPERSSEGEGTKPIENISSSQVGPSNTGLDGDPLDDPCHDQGDNKHGLAFDFPNSNDDETPPSRLPTPQSQDISVSRSPSPCRHDVLSEDRERGRLGADLVPTLLDAGYSERQVQKAIRAFGGTDRAEFGAVTMWIEEFGGEDENEEEENGRVDDCRKEEENLFAETEVAAASERAKEEEEEESRRTAFWEDQLVRRDRSIASLVEWCAAEFVRRGRRGGRRLRADEVLADGTASKKLRTACGTAHAALFGGFRRWRVKVACPADARLDGRAGTIVEWDAKQMKFRVRLDLVDREDEKAKTEKIGRDIDDGEIAYISPNHLEDAEEDCSEPAHPRTGRQTYTVHIESLFLGLEFECALLKPDVVNLIVVPPGDLHTFIESQMKARDVADAQEDARREEEDAGRKQKEILHEERRALWAKNSMHRRRNVGFLQDLCIAEFCRINEASLGIDSSCLAINLRRDSLAMDRLTFECERVYPLLFAELCRIRIIAEESSDEAHLTGRIGITIGEVVGGKIKVALDPTKKSKAKRKKKKRPGTKIVLVKPEHLECLAKETSRKTSKECLIEVCGLHRGKDLEATFSTADLALMDEHEQGDGRNAGLLEIMAKRNAKDDAMREERSKNNKRNQRDQPEHLHGQKMREEYEQQRRSREKEKQRRRREREVREEERKEEEIRKRIFEEIRMKEMFESFFNNGYARRGRDGVFVNFRNGNIEFVFADEEDSFGDSDGYDDSEDSLNDEQRVLEFASLLGVSPDASEQTIKKAYKEKARKFHPDKWKNRESADGMDKGEAEEHFKRINAAYEFMILHSTLDE